MKPWEKVPHCLSLLGNDLLICGDVYRGSAASLITSAFIAGSTPAEANENVNANRFADARSVVDRFSNCL